LKFVVLKESTGSATSELSQFLSTLHRNPIYYIHYPRFLVKIILIAFFSSSQREKGNLNTLFVDFQEFYNLLKKQAITGKKFQ